MNELFERDWPKIDAISGWLSRDEAEVLYSIAMRCESDIVEVGSYKGRSSVCLGLAARLNPNLPFVYAIDPFTGSKEHRAIDPNINTWDEFTANIEANNLDTIIRPMKMTSQEAFPKFQGTLGLVYIDGSHQYEDVKFDFLSWKQLVPSGGWICLHDFNWDDINKMVYECVTHKEYIVPENTIGSLLAIQKR